jgi:uncharacterized protein (TIGR03437 family)
MRKPGKCRTDSGSTIAPDANARSFMTNIRGFFILAAFPAAIYSQASGPPSVTAVLNSASYSTAVEPGSLITIFGSNLAAAAQSATAGADRLPTTLAGTSATVNGVAAPLLYVSPNQINAQLPWMGFAGAGPASLVLTAPGGTAYFGFQMDYVAPGLFTFDSSGCGQAAALNVSPDGSVSVNSPANSAAPGDYLVLFGTGLGAFWQPPPSGVPSTGQQFNDGPGLAIGAALDQYWATGATDLTHGLAPAWAGLAPTLVGTGQVNIRIPDDTREGCAVPIHIETFPYISPTVTVSINRTRGACTDPAAGSYGEVSLVKTIASGTSNDGVTETLFAQFPSAPALSQPPVSANPTSGALLAPDNFHLLGRSCPIAGLTRLTAGPITVTAAGKTPVSVQPTTQTDGAVYQSTLPAGTIAPGDLSISSSGPIAFQDSLTIGSPMIVQTNLSPGTVLSTENPPTIQWTGGDANSIVKLSLVSHAPGGNIHSISYYAPANAHSIALQTRCLSGDPTAPTFCTFFVAPGPGYITLEVLPASTAADSVPAQGLTQKVSLTWSYRYVFDGLTFP